MDAISRIVDLTIGTVSTPGRSAALGPRLLAGMAVVFVESGVLFPFGDSLLVTAVVTPHIAEAR